MTTAIGHSIDWFQRTRRTGHHLPGALLCAAFVAWHVVVGQAAQAA